MLGRSSHTHCPRNGPCFGSDARNWRQPYHGFSQTIVQRSATSGCYFPLEQSSLAVVRAELPSLSPMLQAWVAGASAGATNGAHGALCTGAGGDHGIAKM